jgi:cell wall-associated NlpC family hydrolase
MLQKKKLLTSVLTLLLIALLSTQTTFAYSNRTLKVGMRGDDVHSLQKDLNELGFMTVKPTGYYGPITKEAVLKMQTQYDLLKDGITGKQTVGKLDSLMGRTAEDMPAEDKLVEDKPAEKVVALTSRSNSRSVDSIIDYAKKYMGVKYVWGGTTPKGFDCSGFVKYVYNNFDVSLNRNSAAQAKNGTYIKKGALLPGDLVFFDTNGGKNRINHVGIYIGNGKMIHSSSLYKGVVISTISSGFYSRTYMTARRVLK